MLLPRGRASQASQEGGKVPRPGWRHLQEQELQAGISDGEPRADGSMDETPRDRYRQRGQNTENFKETLADNESRYYGIQSVIRSGYSRIQIIYVWFYIIIVI